MHGDFSRDTYNPASQYSRVLMQMGRVQLDADWNEQTSILLGYMRALTRDLFGYAAGPSADCGFQIVTRDNRDQLSTALAAAVAEALKAENKADLDDDDLMIMPGRYYVAGLPVELRAPMRYRAQPGAPYGSGVTNLQGSAWIVYLDVWEEFVSADQDPHLREAALGGIDTCGRARIQWRVLVGGNPEDRKTSEWSPIGSGRIKVRANPTETGDSLCSVTPDARYRGAENQLYRVEIHRGGAAATGSGATFKWSRDNGAVTFPILRSAGPQVTLAHLGRDEWTTLTEGDWVELIDDTLIALNRGGVLAQVASVDRDDLRVELSLPAGPDALPSYSDQAAGAAHAFLRRWDHKGDEKAGGALAIVEGSEIELEDGIKVTFETGGAYRGCEYWLIAARTATGDVEWPGGPDAPIFRQPDGPAHFFAPLAMQTPAGFEDLRCRIARLPCIEAARATVSPAVRDTPTRTKAAAPKATVAPAEAVAPAAVAPAAVAEVAAPRLDVAAARLDIVKEELAAPRVAISEIEPQLRATAATPLAPGKP
jgi:hypothetical protein